MCICGLSDGGAKKAYILADNRFALDAGWDEDMLRVEMEALQGMDFDISLTGFDEAEIADLLSLDDGDAQEDDFDVDAELAKPCVAKTGDVWHLGKHRAFYGYEYEGFSVCADA